MKVILNGEETEVPVGQSVSDLLDTLSIRTKGIAVELNLEIVPRAEYAACLLSDGDHLEIVTLVGGG
ncbi:MAG: sulfur carrier protein ThiS [Planctomycetaceae bacterium]|nr:sulfur carrier protein ThiS [Planctomycetaceae bacterium]